MTEPDVTLTDYALAVECVVFLVLLERASGQRASGKRARERPAGLRSWYMLFFASMGAASFFGGTVHGFFLDESTLGSVVFWRMTLLAMGVTTLSVWAIGAMLLFTRRVVRWVLAAAGVQLVLYAAVVFFVTQKFWVGIVDSLPAVIFLHVALLVLYVRERRGILLLSAHGPALTLIAALLQQLRIGIHPVYFNHNALYHVLQAIALFLFFLGGRWLIANDNNEELLPAS